ncbi:hypothetical protein JCM5296_002444 [Sporobolomyces johnsonii]
MHPVKRPRTSSPQPDRAARSPQDAPLSAASALQDSIALLASSGLPPALFSKLLASLATAHATVVHLEEELAAKEGDKAAVEVGQPEQGYVAAREPPKEQRWWTASIQVQGELSVVARCVLRDIEDGMPALDQLGILIRPLATDGKVDLLEWEVALPGKAGTDWEGAIIKAALTFPQEYPHKLPRVRTTPPIFHPNAYPSGLLACHSRFEDLNQRDWTTARNMGKDRVMKEEYEADFAQWPSKYRLPLFLEGLLAGIHQPNVDNPAALDPYHMAKYQPEKFPARIRAEAHALMPTAADLVDLAEANRRAMERLDRLEAQQA